MRDLFSLAGKVALVMGGSRGLGLDVAEAMGAMGARVAITARREQWLEPAAAQLRDRGIDCLALLGDVAEPADVNRVCEQTLRQFGQIDVLVNSAGVSWGADPEAMPLEQWERVFRINATGTFLSCQCVGRHMLTRRQGSIINIGSVAGLYGSPTAILNTIGYSATKGAVWAFSRDLAAKWAPYNVRVNVIAPWFFRTRMTEGQLDQSGEVITARIPMGRIGQPGELNGAAVFLASEASAYITGQCINVDGGYSAV